MIIPTTEVFAPLPLPPHSTPTVTHKLQHEVADLESSVRRTAERIQQTTETARQAQQFAEQQRRLAENGVKIMREMPRDDGVYVVHGKGGEVDGDGKQVAVQEQGAEAGVTREGKQAGSEDAANATGPSTRPKVDRFIKTSEVYRTKGELPRRFNEPGIWTHQTTHQHPLYTTTASQYGQYQPTVHEMPTTFHGQSARFSEHLNQAGPYRNHSLNTK
ncbi:hypothetical protein HK097_009572 [Rhizophlyctis rosea]|uniref:Uncharacterized protein n=1 Tax=Rhizophlyctis rosea TaxID=64517 RepID=A0AAD5SBH9_9FUNG|nr:hypothetical protein HK097_009572 [Rhizophlyctis rosea]